MITGNVQHGNVAENGLNAGGPPEMELPGENVFSVVWRGRWIVLIATAVALGLGFLYISKATPIYTSTSRIYVEQSGPRIMTEMAEGVMTQSKNYLYTQAELLKSTPIIATALDSPGARQLHTFADIDNRVGYLKKELETVVGKKDDIISVSFNSPYPTEAAQIVNATVDSYITYHATSKKSTSAEVLKILQNENTRRSKELNEKLTAMMAFKKENEALAFESRQGNLVIERLERLSTVLTEAQLATLESKSVYESTKEMVSDPARLKQFVQAQRARGVYITTGSEKTELESMLEQLELQRTKFLRRVTPGHPAVAALDSDIQRVEAKITNLDAEFAQAHLAVTGQQYLSAKEKEEQIAEYYEQQRQEALALNEQLAEYTILQSDWEQAKKLCDILDDRIKELNVTEDVGALNISILEVARPADKPSAPQKARIMAVALVLGFMLGGALALLRAFMDQKLRSAEEISAVLGVPVLGIVPSMSKRETIVSRGQIVHKDSASRTAEAYRTIRTAVFFGAPKDEAKTILVTSPAAADGKTTLVSNLAIAMAQAGQKVLIVDADFRKPMQHKVFDLDNGDKGLSSVLAGTTTLADAIRPTEVKCLQLLPCGPDVPNPSEILNSESFARLLELLSSKYNRIIIDSPPVMPVTDAQILAAICDVTLLVLRAERSTRKMSQQARDGLLSVGARVLGTIVNDVPRKGRYGYYSSYGYYYGEYGYGRRKKRKPSYARTEAAPVGAPSVSG
jgi:capsular exopolysaccharide synthesis family protein